MRVDDWTATRDTLHMWTQIVGKVRLANSPLVNHWWEVALYVTPRGLTTSNIPYGNASFDIEFDFLADRLVVRSSRGETRTVALEPRTVASFYDETMSVLRELGFETRISTTPNEVAAAIPFPVDTEHSSYDAGAVRQFHGQLVQVERVMKRFRARFVGKNSPVHFFWGSFDMACTRFSGRRAPVHPGGAPNCADWVMVEGYSRELSSIGFWPGGGDEGAFYAYAYPQPDGFDTWPVGPAGAYWSTDIEEFLLPYEKARAAADPDAAALEFFQSTYEAEAELAKWDRELLEEDPHRLDPMRGIEPHRHR
ncbi:hypothetical protein HCA44_04885 [Rhodococcus sp. HNM0569]|nr:DUF5996 family protein [Rhodococcus sp. HNM0569]NLU82112.1 hypothetical protein [Rhodococcus sp. HNM0569]